MPLSPSFGLNDAQRGLMVAVPLLGGAILRLALGVLTDHLGGRRTGIIGLSLTVVPLLMGWLWADEFVKSWWWDLCWASRGPALQWRCRLRAAWYPPE